MNSTNGSGKLDSIKNKIEMARRTKWKKGMREKPLRLWCKKMMGKRAAIICVEESSMCVAWLGNHKIAGEKMAYRLAMKREGKSESRCFRCSCSFYGRSYRNDHIMIIFIEATKILATGMSTRRQDVTINWIMERLIVEGLLSIGMSPSIGLILIVTCSQSSLLP